MINYLTFHIKNISNFAHFFNITIAEYFHPTRIDQKNNIGSLI